MLPIVAERRDMVVQRHDPAPSKMSYRWQRLWLTYWFRTIILLWLPLGAIALLGYMAVTSPTMRSMAEARFAQVRDAVAQRPALMINALSIPVGSEDLKLQIAGIMNLRLPVSSLDTDLRQLRDLVQSLNAVKTAEVRMRPDGTLEVTIVERLPDMVWRLGNRLYLLDETGVKVAEISRRELRADLPFILGVGAEQEIAEAQEIFAIAASIGARIQGLVRVGERRWDMILDRDQAIMLPEIGAVDALLSLLNLNETQDLLARDLSVVDLRDSSRPILRLNDDALQELRRIRSTVPGEPV